MESQMFEKGSIEREFAIPAMAGLDVLTKNVVPLVFRGLCSNRGATTGGTDIRTIFYQVLFMRILT